MRGTWACLLAVFLGGGVAAAAAELVEKQTPAEAFVPWDRKVEFVVSCARDAGTGAIWVGTKTSGAWRFDGKGWTQYTTKDGLGDDAVYALAADLQGRVWVGHVNHGVSVFDGKAWRNYDVLSGGPLGSRVFDIAVCPSGPRAGEVWIASDCGLARYWPKDDSWSYVTRAEGLPADQVQCLAFDADGRVIAGTQCDGLAIASPADDYAAWTKVDGPTRPGTEPEGEGLPSCMINDVLVAREGAIYVATPWGLGKSTDGGKTFTYRRGADWIAKVTQRTGGAPAGFKADDATPVLAEDYVTCLAEDAVGLLWLGYRTMGYEALDEANLASKHAAGAGAAAGRPGEFVTCVLPMFGAGPLVGTYGSGLLQAEKYFSGEGERRAPPVVAGREVGKHPSPAKAPGPRVFDKMRARLAADGFKRSMPLTAAFVGDDWATQGDGIGRYGRQQCVYPSYGAGGWAQGYRADVRIGPHMSKNKGGPYTFYAELDSQSPRVQWIPNNHKRMQGEWNDGSFDRAAYADAWEGPDLWVDVTVPAGVHRMSMYFVNWDAHAGATQRRRDFLVEVKAGGKTLEHVDFAPALARARVRDFYHGVYKQFVLAGPAEYSVKIGRNYSVATKVSAIFFDRLEGPKPAHEPDGVPIMGTAQVSPSALPGDAAQLNAGVRAAAEVVDTLNGAWSRAEAVALQRPYRVLALRVAMDQGAPEALLANWRFRLPLMTAADHAEFVKVTAASREQMWDKHPQTVDTAFRKVMADNWKILQKSIAAGTAQDPATLLNPKPDAADPEAIKAVLAPYLLLRAGARIDTRSLSTDGERQNDFYGDFKRAEKDRKAVYRLVGEYLLYSEALASRPSAKPRRQALAAALAATRATLELLDDTWLAARIAEATLAPQLAHAPDDGGVIGRRAVLAAIIAAHADDAEGLKVAFGKMIESAKGAEAADGVRVELARALHAAGRAKEAAAYLQAVDRKRWTGELEKLRKEIEAKR